ncbi:MAG: nitroreductase family deazaflavin-dependent oxidoreductase [Alphaproteobacteria bacterium]|nr:nitroreductase family deazaflavin-dependent oxidoreductase [Alphaproteobacteria bacterium]
MKIFKWGLIGLLVAYFGLVISVETWLAARQPSFEGAGIPMLVLTTTDDAGQTYEQRLARIPLEGRIYVSAHHWPRGWYRRAVKHPEVRAEIDGVVDDYLAVRVTGEERQRVIDRFPLGLRTRFLMGFPPPRQILRLDPVS